MKGSGSSKAARRTGVRSRCCSAERSRGDLSLGEAGAEGLALQPQRMSPNAKPDVPRAESGREREFDGKAEFTGPGSQQQTDSSSQQDRSQAEAMLAPCVKLKPAVRAKAIARERKLRESMRPAYLSWVENYLL